MILTIVIHSKENNNHFFIEKRMKRFEEMSQLFLFSELIIYILIILWHHSMIKYLGILLCFLYTLYTRKGIVVLLMIIIADYFLLFDAHYIIGMILFIGVQCFYHHMLNGCDLFYLPLCLLIVPSIYTIGICYALLSIYNIINAFLMKHWLFLTLLLLAICDIGVVLQFFISKNIDWIWMSYLPSQVYYVIMVSSSVDETIVKVN